MDPVVEGRTPSYKERNNEQRSTPHLDCLSLPRQNTETQVPFTSVKIKENSPEDYPTGSRSWKQWFMNTIDSAINTGSFASCVGGILGASSFCYPGILAGSAVGSVVPGIGTVAGAVIGGILGVASGWIAGSKFAQALDTPADDIKRSFKVYTGLLGAAMGSWGGFAAGAAIGSVIPFVGTAAGGAIGAIVGVATGYFVGNKTGSYLI